MIKKKILYIFLIQNLMKYTYHQLSKRIYSDEYSIKCYDFYILIFQ